MGCIINLNKKLKILVIFFLISLNIFSQEENSNTQKELYMNGVNNYMGCGIITGIPLKACAGFLGRHGGIVGIGYQLSLGMEISSIDKNKFHGSVGLKFFPYKNAFLSVGYSSLGFKSMGSIGGGGYNPYGGGSSSSFYRHVYGYNQRNGYFATLGGDIFAGNQKNKRYLISVEAGVGYDLKKGDAFELAKDKWIAIFTFKFGYGWALKTPNLHHFR